MVQTRKTRKLRIRRAPTVKVYNVSGNLAKTGPRQEHRTPKQKRVARESAKGLNVQKRGHTKRKMQNTLVSKLYAKAVHQEDTLKEMLKVVEMSDYSKPVRNSVTKMLREQFSE